MNNEIKLQSELKAKFDIFRHPNIGINIYPPDKRLKDFEIADIVFPLTPSSFVLLNLQVNNGVPIFTESTQFLFLSNFVFITSSMGLKFWNRSDGSQDATGTTCKLLFEKTGLKGFALVFDDITKTQQLVIELKDGNFFRSVSFKPSEKISDDFISLLNQMLGINKWL